MQDGRSTSFRGAARKTIPFDKGNSLVYNNLCKDNLFQGEVKVLTGGDARLSDKSTSLAGPSGWESRTDGIVRMKETQDTLCIL